VGGGLWVGLRDRQPPAARVPAPPGSTSFDRFAICIAGAIVAALWLGWTAYAYRHGMETTDTLWYHLPQAARFVQNGYIRELQCFDGQPVTAFYPANAELVHALGMLALKSDLLSPLINLFWGWLCDVLGLDGGETLQSRCAHAARDGAASRYARLHRYAARRCLQRHRLRGAARCRRCRARPGRREPRPAGGAAMAAGLCLGTKFTMIVPAVALGVALVGSPPRCPADTVRRSGSRGWSGSGACGTRGTSRPPGRRRRRFRFTSERFSHSRSELANRHRLAQLLRRPHLAGVLPSRASQGVRSRLVGDPCPRRRRRGRLRRRAAASRSPGSRLGRHRRCCGLSDHAAVPRVPVGADIFRLQPALHGSGTRAAAAAGPVRDPRRTALAAERRARGGIDASRGDPARLRDLGDGHRKSAVRAAAPTDSGDSRCLAVDRADRHRGGGDRPRVRRYPRSAWTYAAVTALLVGGGLLLRGHTRSAATPAPDRCLTSLPGRGQCIALVSGWSARWPSTPCSARMTPTSSSSSAAEHPTGATTRSATPPNGRARFVPAAMAGWSWRPPPFPSAPRPPPAGVDPRDSRRARGDLEASASRSLVRYGRVVQAHWPGSAFFFCDCPRSGTRAGRSWVSLGRYTLGLALLIAVVGSSAVGASGCCGGCFRTGRERRPPFLVAINPRNFAVSSPFGRHVDRRWTGGRGHVARVHPADGDKRRVGRSPGSRFARTRHLARRAIVPANAQLDRAARLRPFRAPPAHRHCRVSATVCRVRPGLVELRD
jgi:hypothetical protein